MRGRTPPRTARSTKGAPVPLEPNLPAHPPIPFGAASRITLTAALGGIASFITAWITNGLSPETVALGAATAGMIIALFAGRSHQASVAIQSAIAGYQGQAMPPTPTPVAPHGDDTAARVRDGVENGAALFPAVTP